MELREIPPLPFEPTVASASEWLDGLPVGDTLKSCRILYPVLFSLRLHPVPLRPRFELLEAFQPAILSVVHSLSLRVTHKPLADGRTQRSLADYCYRFHIVMAECYRDLLRDRAFIPVFHRHERAVVVARALKHLGSALLRKAQVYEMPPAGLWRRVARLYRYAETQVLLDESVEAVSGPPTTPRIVFQRILLFRLAAPGRMDPREMQGLFDRLAVHAGAADWADERGCGRLLFRFDACRPGMAVPHLAADPPDRDVHFATAGTLLGGSVAERVGADHAHSDGLIRALPRLGRPLRCGERETGERAELLIGFKAVAMALRFLEVRGIRQGGIDYWPRLCRVDFAPLDDDVPESEGDGHGAVALSLARANAVVPGSEAERGTADIVPAELPGFCLVDTGFEALRAGHLLGIRDGEEWIRLAAVRGGQVHEGRFRHSAEILGNFPRLADVRGEGAALESARSGFVLDDRNHGGGVSLVVAPVRWTRGHGVRVDGFRGQELFRIGRLLEWNADFCHYELVEAVPAEEEPKGAPGPD